MFERVERKIRAINRKAIIVTVLNLLTWASLAALAWAFHK